MDKLTIEAIKAIKGSIAKWDLIAHGVIADRKSTNCPLCKEFYCYECPVYSKTKREQCSNTPYEHIYLTPYKLLPRWVAEMKELKELYLISDTLDAIEGEVEFLISLLPCEDKQKYNL